MVNFIPLRLFNVYLNLDDEISWPVFEPGPGEGSLSGLATEEGFGTASGIQFTRLFCK